MCPSGNLLCVFCEAPNLKDIKDIIWEHCDVDHINGLSTSGDPWIIKSRDGTMLVKSK